MGQALLCCDFSRLYRRVVTLAFYLLTLVAGSCVQVVDAEPVTV
jgi:hypothetical protein